MYIRIAAAVAAIAAGTLAGVYYSYRLKSRETRLRELHGAVKEMSLLIRHRALPVGELFTELSRYEFFREVRDMNGDSGDFRGSWAAAADSLCELAESDKAVLRAVGASLGTSDVAGQVAMLEVNAELLAGYAGEARDEYARKGKLYKSVGLLAGAFAAILLL